MVVSFFCSPLEWTEDRSRCLVMQKGEPGPVCNPACLCLKGCIWLRVSAFQLVYYSGSSCVGNTQQFIAGYGSTECHWEHLPGQLKV